MFARLAPPAARVVYVASARAGKGVANRTHARIRRFTTPTRAGELAGIAQIIAVFFQGCCLTVNALEIRAYARLSRREATLALMDIFGAPYAHYHSDEEVALSVIAELPTCLLTM